MERDANSGTRMITQSEKEYLFFSNPKCMEVICDNVSNGGSVVELSKTLGIRYCDIMKFIRSNPDHSKMYDQALDDRNEWVKETVLKELRSITLEDSETDKVTGEQIKAATRDRLKAIELLGKNLKLFTDNVKHDVGSKLEDLILASYQK